VPTSDFYEFGAQLRAFMSGLQGGPGGTPAGFPTSTTHRRSRSSRLRLAGSITSGCHPLIPS
jgi:hypothetical protein